MVQFNNTSQIGETYPGIASKINQAYQIVLQKGAFVSDVHAWVKKADLGTKISITLREVDAGQLLTLTHAGYTVLGAVVGRVPGRGVRSHRARWQSEAWLHAAGR